MNTAIKMNSPNYIMYILMKIYLKSMWEGFSTVKFKFNNWKTRKYLRNLLLH